jgi:hypothetical protein
MKISLWYFFQSAVPLGVLGVDSVSNYFFRNSLQGLLDLLLI